MEKNVESAEKSSENDIDEDNLVLRPLLWRAWENQVGNPSEDEAKKAGRGKAIFICSQLSLVICL